MEVMDEMWGRIAWIASTLLFHSIANSDYAFSKSILQNSRAPTSGSSLTKSSLLSVQITSIWMKQKGEFKQVSKLLFTCICGHCSDYMIHTSIFKACLKEHKKRCPPKKTKHGASMQLMPGWQREMSQAVQEMEQFSDAEGTNENGGADGGEDEDGDDGDAGEDY